MPDKKNGIQGYPVTSIQNLVFEKLIANSWQLIAGPGFFNVRDTTSGLVL